MGEYNKISTSLIKVEKSLDAAPASEKEYERLMVLTRRLSDIIDIYEETLPRAPLGRCPISGLRTDHSFDPFGFDGLWWNYENPVRPYHENEAGPNFLGITGAVRLASDIENTSFLVEPGPDAPFVVPRILSQQSVIAVILLVAIGAHRGAVITYYAPGGGPGLPDFPQWGIPFDTMNIAERRRDVMPTAALSDYDFDLTPWVRSGKLQWIMPGDSALQLHKGIEGCPYLSVRGERKLQRLYCGKRVQSA